MGRSAGGGRSGREKSAPGKGARRARALLRASSRGARRPYLPLQGGGRPTERSDGRSGGDRPRIAFLSPPPPPLLPPPPPPPRGGARRAFPCSPPPPLLPPLLLFSRG